jgi:hypothetical protein
MLETSIVLRERTKQIFFLPYKEAVMKWRPIIMVWINMPVGRFQQIMVWINMPVGRCQQIQIFVSPTGVKTK